MERLAVELGPVPTTAGVPRSHPETLLLLRTPSQTQTVSQVNNSLRGAPHFLSPADDETRPCLTSLQHLLVSPHLMLASISFFGRAGSFSTPRCVFLFSVPLGFAIYLFLAQEKINFIAGNHQYRTGLE